MLDIGLHVSALLLNYTIWHTRMMLDVMPCEYLFMGYPTTVSQQISAYSRTVAAANGCDVAVIENYDHVLTNVEDEPLFLVFGHEVYTSPIECGATDSVMRRLIFEACRRKNSPARRAFGQRDVDPL